VVVNIYLYHIYKIIEHFVFQKKGQLGHPDEINAKAISLFSFEEQRSVFNQGVPKVFKQS